MSFTLDWVDILIIAAVLLVNSYLIYRAGYIDGRIHEQRIFSGWIDEQVKSLTKELDKYKKPKRGRPAKK